MSAAIAAMLGAALEAELAVRRQRAGFDALVRRRAGWAVILFLVGLALFLQARAIG